MGSATSSTTARTCRPGRQDDPERLYYYGVERRAHPAVHGRDPRQQQVRRDFYEVLGPRDDRPGRVCYFSTVVRGLLGRSPMLSGYVGRWHRKRRDGGHYDVQRRRRLGQREEVLRE